MEIARLAEEHYDLWDRFVLSNNEGVFYHLSCWGRAISEAYNLEFIIVVAKDTGRILCGLPLIRFKLFFREYAHSMPYAANAGFCGGDKAMRNKIETYLLDNFGFSFIEFREYGTHDIGPSSMVTQIMDLTPGSEAIWKKINSAERSCVRKARKLGLSISQDRNGLDVFYDIFSKKMHQFGTPPHSKKLMSSIFKYGEGNVDLLVINKQGNTIGGIFLGYAKDRIYDPWVAVDDGYKQLSPYDFLYWSTVIWACEKGFKYFDMGRSKKDTGVYKFKKKWGAYDVPLCYRRLFQDGTVRNISEHRVDSCAASLFASLWRKIPAALNNSLGPRIRKYIP